MNKKKEAEKCVEKRENSLKLHLQTLDLGIKCHFLENFITLPYQRR
jgi:hypothetical protein